MNRRHFFYSAGMALTASQATRVMGANDKINVGVIGLGGRGQAHMGSYMKIPEARITALCDVDQASLERGTAKVKKEGHDPKGYVNMKDVFADKNVDAVSMPLPNHWHALSTIWAIQGGKDVYVEKPASHNIYEGLKMIEAARKYKRMVQIGSQSRTMAHKMKAIELLRAGEIGEVYMAKGLCFKRRKSIGKKPDGPTPPGVDWDLFLGPAPKRAFNENRFKYNWHWFWDTGNGDIGNQGIHEMDIARWGLGVDLPNSGVSTGGKYAYDDDQETANTQMATFDYGGKKEIMFEVRGLTTGTEGGLPHRGNVVGNLFYGSEGWMALDGGSFQIYKGEKNEKTMDVQADRKDETVVHMSNFLAACRSRNYKDLTADVEIGVRSVALVHIANISYRLGRKLNFDPASMKFIGDAEANKMLTRPYRSPYVVPEKV